MVPKNTCPHDLLDDLARSMTEETAAAAAYRKRGELARSKGNEFLAGLYEHIAGEEDHHFDQYLGALRDVAMMEKCSG